MPRSRRAAKPAAVRLSAPHFEPLDLDAWAGPVVSHAGREAALLGRVEALRLSPDGLILDARVRDAGPTPYHVTIARQGERFDASAPIRAAPPASTRWRRSRRCAFRAPRCSASSGLAAVAGGPAGSHGDRAGS